jgi:hypothetical protein
MDMKGSAETQKHQGEGQGERLRHIDRERRREVGDKQISRRYQQMNGWTCGLRQLFNTCVFLPLGNLLESRVFSAGPASLQALALGLSIGSYIKFEIIENCTTCANLQEH